MNDIQVQTNNAVEQSATITAELYRRYIEYLDASPKTIETYSKALKQFFNYLNANGITQPTRETVLNFKEELSQDHKPTTVQNYIIAVRLFFQWTAIENLYPNIAAHIKGARISREYKKDYLTTAQLKTIIAGIDQDAPHGRRDYAIFVLMVTCGLRDIEVSRANIEDMRASGDNTVLYIQGKGREERTEYVIIPEPAEHAIRAYLAERSDTDESGPLFTSTSNNNRGGRLTTRSISGTIKKILRAAGYDSDRLTAHSLRHTAVTLSLLGGDTLQQAQQFARHKNITTTEIYAHNLDKAKNPCSNTVADAIF